MKRENINYVNYINYGGFEQPGLIVGVAAHGREGLELDDL